ncbi:endolytic transglycosylase MltG [Marinobacter vulgaris]|uniref:Endolytic murein transglycosylase n=1 Tax=Marinobacter vulgaris TaxID=1928331 RepID=A0A2V3ZKH3_9GAMM|nr:endolytic transglycosylase MltG [Marinobacter vulgaris]PXX90930.1 endolytic transglycosylase MltG [Marinobacter vulgaris]TSJ70088.1 endolytic transglycosylase MltG [Marinobacter vulgaris]
MFKKLSISLFCLVVLAVAGSSLWVWQGLESLEQPVALSEPVLFSVPSGSGYGQVARKLEEEGLAPDSVWLKIHGRLFPEQTRLKAGEYEFTSGMSTLDMISMMVAGATKHWQIQFIEGWTFRDMRRALASSDRLEKITTDWTGEKIMKAMGAEGEHPEGRFFPDTYLFTSSESDLDLLRRAFEKMEEVLAAEWESRAEKLPYDSPYEALIMASIVERETGAAHEREEVAGVFVRRLNKGMRLQTDPTVIYGMGEKYQGRITRRDLQTRTDYNTYRIDGLPPTPIALPGEEAIHAALNPADGDALYFVARGDGTHKFSRTLQEHQKAVREFQLNRRSDYRSSPAPVPAPGSDSRPASEANEQ